MTNKRAFVLIRGLGREARHWGSFSEGLKAQPFCSQVFLCDLPGAGVYHREPGVFRVSEMVRHLAENYHSVFSVSKPLTIIGMSLGGMVAMEYIASFPELFSEFILINSSSGGLSPSFRRILPACLPLLAKIAIARTLAQKERLILKLVSRMRQNDELALSEHIRIAESAPVKFETLAKQVAAAAFYKAPKLDPRKPGLILYSKRDGMVDASCSIELSSYLSIPAIAHPEAGHDLTFDDADWAIQQIASFLERP